MLNRKIVLALAAISTMTAAALAPTSASAMRGSFGGGGMRATSMHVSTGVHIGSSSFGRTSFARTSFTRTRGGNGKVSVCVLRTCGGGNPPVTWWPPHHHHVWPPIYVGWHHQHWGVGEVDVGTTAVDAAVDTAAAPAAPCNCLTKEYLPDGSVLFKDLCTKEAALATPAELKAQADGIAPTAQ